MDIITAIETTKLDITVIRKLLAGHASVLLYKTLASKSGDVFSEHDCVVVLYESKIGKRRLGHYVALIKRNDKIEYFSSLGKSPEDELDRLGLGETPKFASILRGSGTAYSYNRIAVQNRSDYEINTCGLWVVARCLLRKLSNAQFIRLFKSNQKTSDEKIAMATLLLLKRFAVSIL